MILLVGSLAAQFHIEGFRKARDIDLIATMGDMMSFVEEHAIEVSPISKTKFVGKWDNDIVDIEVAPPGSAAEMLLDRVTGSVIDFMGQKLFLPELDWLYTIKMSHRYAKNSPDFKKTMDDIRAMRPSFTHPPHIDREWVCVREAENEATPRTASDVKKYMFFDEAQETPTYDRDQLHEVAMTLSNPAHKYYEGENKDGWCEKQWDACTLLIKDAGVLEECYVSALENCLIPHPSKILPNNAFLMALEKICTSGNPDWFREHAWENYEEISNQYSPSFFTRYQAAIKLGSLKPVVKAAS